MMEKVSCDYYGGLVVCRYVMGLLFDIGGWLVWLILLYGVVLVVGIWYLIVYGGEWVLIVCYKVMFGELLECIFVVWKVW